MLHRLQAPRWPAAEPQLPEPARLASQQVYGSTGSKKRHPQPLRRSVASSIKDTCSVHVHRHGQDCQQPTLHGGSAMATAQTSIYRFLNACSQAIAARAQLPQEVHGGRVLAEQLQTAAPRIFEPSWQPALHDIKAVQDTPLARDFTDVAPHLPWLPTLIGGDGGTLFARAPVNDMLDLGAATVGILYLSAGSQLPLHRHAPQELYFTISGQGEWRFGGTAAAQPVGPGQVLYNHPNDYHTAAAGASPVVALYLLW